MPPIVWLFHLLILAVVLTLAAFLVVVMTAVVATTMLVAFVLHKLGWDRRLIAYLMSKQQGRTSPPVKVKFDDMDEPIEAHWTLEEPGR